MFTPHALQFRLLVGQFLTQILGLHSLDGQFLFSFLLLPERVTQLFLEDLVLLGERCVFITLGQDL
jgi:hypothetical protein